DITEFGRQCPRPGTFGRRCRRYAAKASRAAAEVRVGRGRQRCGTGGGGKRGGREEAEDVRVGRRRWGWRVAHPPRPGRRGAKGGRAAARGGDGRARQGCGSGGGGKRAGREEAANVRVGRRRCGWRVRGAPEPDRRGRITEPGGRREGVARAENEAQTRRRRNPCSIADWATPVFKFQLSV